MLGMVAKEVEEAVAKALLFRLLIPSWVAILIPSWEAKALLFRLLIPS
jgi:hypothetical protein